MGSANTLKRSAISCSAASERSFLPLAILDPYHYMTILLISNSVIAQIGRAGKGAGAADLWRPRTKGVSMEHFTPAASLVGGVLIGLSASALLLCDGKVAGVSGI